MGVNRLLLAMGSNFGDLDNDGWLDFYLGTGEPDLGMLMPNRMFRNDRGQRFQDVTTSGGFGHLQKGHAVAFADLDHDGDQDVYQVLGGAFAADVYRNALFENPGHSNQWIKIKLHGAQANRPGVGARLKLTIQDGNERRVLHRVVGSGGSFGANPFRQEIGLGKATRVEELMVTWPGSGTVQRFKDLPAEREISIREDSPEVEIRDLARFAFPSDKHDHHHH
jgi:hypothetical protein